MKGFENQVYLVLYIISNVAALLILWAAWKRPRLARLIFFFLFAAASWTNWNAALSNPQVYLDYADVSFLPVYRQFIQGWFSQHITVMVGLIATAQTLIAVSMLLRGLLLNIGVVGAIVFLIAIAPLGVGSAFPFSITASLALYLILKEAAQDYLWITQRSKISIPKPNGFARQVSINN